MEEAFREEEREQDRLHAATGSGIFKRATSAGQLRRPLYTKHKISNPLSCPGKLAANACEVRYYLEQNSKSIMKRSWFLSYGQDVEHLGTYYTSCCNLTLHRVSSCIVKELSGPSYSDLSSHRSMSSTIWCLIGLGLMRSLDLLRLHYHLHHVVVVGTMERGRII